MDGYILQTKIYSMSSKRKDNNTRKKLIIAIFFVVLRFAANAQNDIDSIHPVFTLNQCIDYAVRHQPALQKSLLDIDIAKVTKAINFSGWYPQIDATANLTHYLELPTTISSANGTQAAVKSGVYNTAIPGIGVTQTIFSPSLQYSVKSANLNIQQTQVSSDSSKIELIAAVSKSFYSLLLTLQQIDVLKEDTIRLGQNVRDTYHQYIGGIVDETDYEEATITLNNSMSQLKQANENVVPQYAILKQLMGYAPEKQFNISFDTIQMKDEIYIDTAIQLDYQKRIELAQLHLAKQQQQLLTDYYKKAALPTLSGFFNYNYSFENNQFPQLFAMAYPNSLLGLTLSVPIFNGYWRVQNIKRSSLQEKSFDWSEQDIKANIYAQYTSALANYKTNLYNLQVLKDNVAMAKRVYFVVTLQYKQGVVAYLNVITAEANLIQSEIGYVNALFQVLSSKIDLEKAMGNIPY